MGADDNPGWAYSLSSSLKLADLMTVTFNMSQTDPNFHKLSDRFGSRIASKNWGISADVDVLKLLPFNMEGSNLKVNYSHTEQVGNPVYLPGTDIAVEQAAEQQDIIADTSAAPVKTGEQLKSEVQTMNVSDTYSASNIKLRIPTDFWLIRDTFNSLTFGFNYNKRFSRSPTILSNKSWVWNANVNYALNLGQSNYFEPVNIPVVGTVLSFLTDYRDVKIYYTPQTFNMNIAANRSRSIIITRDRPGSPGTITPPNRDFTTSRGMNFNWKITEGGFLNLSTNYSVTINSSLLSLETNENNLQRRESLILRDIFSGVFFGEDYRYQQSIDFRTNPRLPSLWNINKYFTVTAGYSANYQWSFDFRQGPLGRSAGFSSRANAGITLRLKSLFEPLFAEESNGASAAAPANRGKGNGGGKVVRFRYTAAKYKYNRAAGQCRYA